MTASDIARRKRRTAGLTVTLLGIATIGLAVACAALGQEVLTLGENIEKAAEIEARLRMLEEEHESSAHKKAELEAEISRLRPQAEEARTEANKLKGLRADVSRTRAERDRLAKEVEVLTTDRGTLHGTVGMLTEQKESLKAEGDGLAGRAEAERKRLDEVQQAVNERRAELTRFTDALAAEKQKLAQVETDLANTDRFLVAKRAELKGLTAEEQVLRAEIAQLKKTGEKLEAANRSEEEQSASLRKEAVDGRTALATVQGQLNRAREELARTKATLDNETAQAEAVAARLQRLTSLEATARLRIRDMIADLSETERTHAGSESRQ